MKKLLSLVLVLACALSLVACGGSEEAEEGPATAKVIEHDLTVEDYAFGVDSTQPELVEKANEFIAKVKEDGTLDAICDKYFGGGEATPVVSAELDESKDQLVVATNLAFEPFEYLDGENIVGIDMELAGLLAEYLGKELVIMNMDFDAVCLAVGQQKCDIAMAGLTVTEDRKEILTFTDSYYKASQLIIVPAASTEFDACADVAAVEAILNGKDAKVKVGVQTGTTGQFYCEGDADWGFAGFAMETVGYKNGSLAVQDLLNGNIDYVIIDSAPAACIVESINKLQ
jgi:polar amino acid transport system substrate-binding protein